MNITKNDLKKISEYIYEIPKSFRSDMRVPARVFAAEKLLEEIFRDRSMEQLVNIATLPGIQKNAIAMPDAHEGYGFCLSKDAKILSEFGYYLPIEDFANIGTRTNLKIWDYNKRELQNADIKKFFKIKPTNKVLKIKTKSGRSIIATEDHPFYTMNGMKPLKEITPKDKVAVHGFEGVPFEKPSRQTIIAEKDIQNTLSEMGIDKESPRFRIIIKKLKNRNLFPLTYDHPKLPYLIKICAFVFGDGSMNFIGKRGDGIIHFSGKAEDLEEVKRDLEKIGYTSSPIHSREHQTKIGRTTINHTFTVNAASLIVLLETLGVPRGKKVSQSYCVPKWIFEAPLWQKRLFLAVLFGCELRMPHRRLNRRGNFDAPVFVMAKSEDLLDNGKKFLQDIAKLLSDFGVQITNINQRRRHVARNGTISHSLELIISCKPENLINLWSRISFEYNKKRTFLASVAVCYLRLKQALLQEKEEAIKIHIPELLKEGLNYSRIADQLSGNPLSVRFIKDVCWKIKNGWKRIIPRVPPSFPTFDEYLNAATVALGNSGLVWEKIVSLKEIKFNDFVYDLTIEHSSHNFLANGFLVSNCIGGVAAMDLDEGVISPGGIGYDINCGVRLLRSPVKWLEVKDKLGELATEIYEAVPSGLGRGGKLVLDKNRLDLVLGGGAGYMVEQGYGAEKDLLHLEAQGHLSEADPTLVSNEAKSRGRDQLGTIGSGNHFLEIQRVDEIFDDAAAKAFKLFKDQLVILIHTGSRGLGHQIATDYIRLMMKVMPNYGIILPDRELACVPFRSPEGQKYFAAMCAGANFAWANRQTITHWIRESWRKVLGNSSGELEIVYDVAHNIAKIERYAINGVEKELCVHRKGATRAFGPKNPELPTDYQPAGQPVLIPGSMGTASYVLVGTAESAALAFSTSCHGAGRRMSRHGAKKIWRGSDLKKQLEAQGIVVRAGSMSGLAEEAPLAYKDVEAVVDAVHGAGLAKKVARLKPLAVIKG